MRLILPVALLLCLLFSHSFAFTSENLETHFGGPRIFRNGQLIFSSEPKAEAKTSADVSLGPQPTTVQPLSTSTATSAQTSGSVNSHSTPSVASTPATTAQTSVNSAA